MGKNDTAIMNFDGKFSFSCLQGEVSYVRVREDMGDDRRDYNRDRYAQNWPLPTLFSSVSK